MAHYLLSVIHPENRDIAPAERDTMFRQVDALNVEIKKAGAWVFAGGLHPSSTATTLRLKDGDVITTDGPFAEAAEHMGGFWIIQAADLDAALDWARKATHACGETIEVRPFQGEPAS